MVFFSILVSSYFCSGSYKAGFLCELSEGFILLIFGTGSFLIILYLAEGSVGTLTSFLALAFHLALP